MNAAKYAKAIVGALVAGLTSLGTALTDGAVSASEWVSVALAFLLGLGVVYAAPKNRSEDGAVNLGPVLTVMAVLVLVLVLLSLLGHPAHVR